MCLRVQKSFGKPVINEVLHLCAPGVNIIVDNICRLSPDLLAEAVSMFYLQLYTSPCGQEQVTFLQAHSIVPEVSDIEVLRREAQVTHRVLLNDNNLNKPASSHVIL